MGNNRQYIRIKCNSQCIIADTDGSAHMALLEDISIDGALIKVSHGISSRLNVGDTCNVMLCHNPNSFPVKHSCKVIRKDMVNMGVRFLTNRFL